MRFGTHLVSLFQLPTSQQDDFQLLWGAVCALPARNRNETEKQLHELISGLLSVHAEQIFWHVRLSSPSTLPLDASVTLPSPHQLSRQPMLSCLWHARRTERLTRTLTGSTGRIQVCYSGQVCSARLCPCTESVSNTQSPHYPV